MKILQIKSLAILVIIQLLSFTAQANTQNQVVEGISNNSLLLGVLIGTFAILLTLFATVAGIAFSILKFYSPREEEKVLEEQTPFWQWFWLKFNAAVPQSQEKDIVMGHSYDGIRELDNDMPPWWKYGFYMSIVFAGIYLYVYHGGYNEHEVSVREYMAENQQAAIDKKVYLAKTASLIDESNIVLLDGSKDLGEGMAVYIQNCKVCHGGAGEGGVGPNLTDPYWINGGGISDIFSTIKYGVQEKGMIAWEKKLTPKQMQQLTSFIVSLENTNPANAKDPQGEKYERKAAVESADGDLSAR